MTAASQLQSRSIGLKLLIIAMLALFLAIATLFIGAIVRDRTSRAAAVLHDVSTQVGGPQTFLGPTLLIPYTIASPYPGAPISQGTFFVFPQVGNAVFKTSTQLRHRSLFRVPVFQTEAQFTASFDLQNLSAAIPPGALLDWSRAELVVGASDVRGALADAQLSVNGTTTVLTPATSQQMLNLAPERQGPSLHLFGTTASAFATPQARFSLSSTLHFSGAQRLAVLAFAKTTHVAITGDWPDPGFDGNFLPTQRTVSRRGFSAQWSIPLLARGVDAMGILAPPLSSSAAGSAPSTDALGNLDQTAMGVSFVQLADPYQSVSRALKYALLFIGLVFLSYFLFEVTTARLLHPAQYVLVGAAQLIFYLLLLSLAERVGFGLAFLLAGSATVALLSINAKWVFSATRNGLQALAIFSTLYTFIYLLLRLQDNALLLGAASAFSAVALAMYLTRSIDWYGSSPTSAQPGAAGRVHVPEGPPAA